MTGFCGPIRHSQHELLERDRNASKLLKKKKKKEKKYQNSLKKIGQEISEFILCFYTLELIFAPRVGVLSQMLLEIAFLIEDFASIN